MSSKVDERISQMTRAEKCALLSGAGFWNTEALPRLGVPSVVVSDGPHGLRKQETQADNLGLNESVPATCFPSESAMACSFDPGLIERVGVALGEECRAQGVSVLLGPAINMKRSPLCGRNFEYLSEDPYLTGVLASAYVRGLQSTGVGASVKHFAGNSQETARLIVDSVIDERALHEIYLRAFEMVVRDAHPWTIMSAYNRLNGIYCSENHELLEEILRGTWGFDGLVVTDWGAASDLARGVQAGCDLIMPGPRPDLRAWLRRGLHKGTLSVDDIDRAAGHVLEFADRATHGHAVPVTCNLDAHLALAHQVAAESAVLLENDGELPLEGVRSGADSLAVIGALAKKPRYQGAGSSKIVPIALDSPFEALAEAGIAFDYAAGYDVATGESDDAAAEAAVECARTHDVAVLFVGLPARMESEGLDRSDMLLPMTQNDLVERICTVNPRTVVVLQGGAPFEMPWRHLPAAVLLTYLSGCQGGAATVDLLLGNANPSGHLAETWPVRLADTPTAQRFPSADREVLYTESIYIGYRYFDAVGLHVAYPFGHGLSYTTFSYDDLAVDNTDDGFRVSFTLENTGTRAGAEVAQLYVAALDPGVFKAPQTLQAFQKVFLEPGERCTVTLALGQSAFEHYDTRTRSWTVEAGLYELIVGSSSRDIRLKAFVDVAGVPRSFDGVPDRYHHPAKGCFSAHTDDTYASERAACAGSCEDFGVLYGRPLPKRLPLRPFTLDSSLSDIRNGHTGRFIDWVFRRELDAAVKNEETKRTLERLAADMPIRSVSMGGRGVELAYGMVDLVNHRYIRGWREILHARFTPDDHRTSDDSDQYGLESLNTD